MHRVGSILVLLMVLVGAAQAEVIGPLIRVDADFPGYAVFQVNGSNVKRGQKVTLQRSDRPLVHGKITEASHGRCLVKFDQELPMFRGDLLHAQVKADLRSGPSLGTPYRKSGIKRSKFSRHQAKRKIKAGRSPHVITPAELAAQSRRSSLYSLGRVHNAKSMAGQSRRTSEYTMGGVMSVKEFAKQMNR